MLLFSHSHWLVLQSFTFIALIWPEWKLSSGNSTELGKPASSLGLCPFVVFALHSGCLFPLELNGGSCHFFCLLKRLVWGAQEITDPSSEGMMLKLKLQYFGQLMRRVDSLENTLLLGEIGGRRRKGRPRMRWLDSITDSTDVSLSELREMVMDRVAWRVTIHGVAKSWTRRSDWTTLSFFVIRMHTDLFQSYGHCWVCQICWHIECSTFTISSFRIWNSSTGILSPPLALFLVMLSKAHLTSHSRMSQPRWVLTPSWLSGLWRSFFYSSSVYSCSLFLISSASVRSIPFLSFILPILIFLKCL